MTAQVCLGLVGLGGAAMQLLPSLVADDRIEIAGVVEPNAAAREAFSADFGVPGFRTVLEMVSRPEIDAVYIATPHGLHKEQATTALEAGKHVVVEKPLALTVDDCLAVDAASRASGAGVVVGHSHAFDKPVRRIRSMLQDGTLGPVAMISAWSFGSFLYRPRRPEELDTSLGGGIVYNQVPHQVDVARLLGGAVRSVRSSVFLLDETRPTEGAHTTFLEFENGAAASLVFSGYDRFNSDEFHGWIGENGNVASPTHGAATRALLDLPEGTSEGDIKAQRGYYAGWKPTVNDGSHRQPHLGLMVVSCENADVRVSPEGLVVYDVNGARNISIPTDGPVPDKSEVLEDLYQLVINNQPSLHDAQWGAATLEVCNAILTSSAERREVRLSRQMTPHPGQLAPS